MQNSAPGEVASFLRRDTNDEFLVLINLSSRRTTGSVQLATEKAFDPVKINGMPEPVEALLPDFQLNGYGWFIYHRAIAK